MRNSKERLAEIRSRADARIAAIHKRNRAVAGVCTTFAMCIAIGLGVYRALSVPPTPPLVPPVHTTTACITTDTTVTHTTVSTTTTSFSKTDTTQDAVTTTTTVILIEPPGSSAPISVTTTETQIPSSRTTSRTVTTQTTMTTTASPTTIPFTTTVPPTVPSSSPTAVTMTTALPTTTTAAPDDSTDGTFEGGSNIQSPSYDGTTTTTNDRGVQGVTGTPSATTTTTCASTETPSENVILSVSSARNVAVGDILTVEIAVSDYHCIVAGELYIQYDPDALQLLGQDQSGFGNILNGAYALEVQCPAEGDIKLLFSSSAIEGSIQGGTVLRLEFEVRDGLRDGTSVICEVPRMVSNHGSGDYDTPVTVINGTIIPADTRGYDWWI